MSGVVQSPESHVGKAFVRHHASVRALLRVLLVLCALTWWLLPGMGVIDLSVTWDRDWPVMLEAGWGVLFTVGLGLPFLVTAARPRLARVALVQLHVVAAALLVGVVAGVEPQAWWIFVGLLIEVPLVHAVAPRERLGRAPVHRPLLTLALVALPAGLGYAWEMAELNRLALPTSDITNDVDHYAVQAALGVALVALPAAAALWPATRRLLGTSTALMAFYTALVSYHWPLADGGFSAGWSVAVMAWSVAVMAAAWWPVRSRQPEVSDPGVSVAA